MTTVIDNGHELRLRTRIGSGGEAYVYIYPAQPNLCIKIYHKPLTNEQLEKISILTEDRFSKLRSTFAIPIRLVKNSSGRPCGFVMNKFNVCGQLHQLSNPSDRAQYAPFADGKFLLKLATQICEGLALAHSLGLVIGDLSDRNLGFTKNGDAVFFDVDSAQVKKDNRIIPARMGFAEFVDPRAKGPNGRWRFDKESDEYSLCINVFKLFFRGRHPFSGAIPIKNELNNSLTIEHLMRMGMNINDDNCKKNFPVKRNETLPSILEVIPDPLCIWISETFSMPFEKKHRVPASIWARNLSLLKGSINTCNVDRSHIWLTETQNCPWCKRLNNFSRTQLMTKKQNVPSCNVRNCKRPQRSDSIWCDYHWLVHPTQQSSNLGSSTSSSSWLNNLISSGNYLDVCGAKNRDGSECQNRPLKGNKRCQHHYGKWRSNR